jgi:ATP-binding cassette, subfamily C, bacterial LapB
MNFPSPFRLRDLIGASVATARSMKGLFALAGQVGLKKALQSTKAAPTKEAEGEAAGLSLIDAMVALLARTGEDATPQGVSAALPLAGDDLDPRVAPIALSRFRLSARWARIQLVDISPDDFPCILRLKDGRYLLAMGVAGDGRIRLANPAQGAKATVLESLETLILAATGDVLLVGSVDPINGDEASDDAEAMRERPRTWILARFLEDRPILIRLGLAAVLLNLCAMAMPMYQRAVYDRVIPNLAIESLWALSIGIVIALVFEFMLRNIRADFIEAAGLRVSHLVQHRVIAGLLAAKRENSTVESGTLQVALRDVDGLAHLIPMALVTFLVDMPFFFIFIALLWMTGGPIAGAAAIGAIIIMFLGLVAATGLGAMSERGSRLARARSNQVVDVADGLLTIKANQYEGKFLRDWSIVSDHLALSGHAQRQWMEWSNALTATSVQGVTVLVLIVGVYLMQTGEMTVGALIACSLLAGRAMSPIAQATMILSKANQALSQFASLGQLLSLPPEADVASASISGQRINGGITFKSVTFGYEKDGPPALKDVNLTINAGERIALVGKSGSGKSTLLQLAGCLADPSAGKVLFDGFPSDQYGVSRVRSAIAFASQDALIFDMSLKDNLLLGATDATEEEMINAVKITGVDLIAAGLPDGFGAKLGARGGRLSVGQRQAVLVARAIIRKAPILLLDEPTASLDSGAEARLRDGLIALPRTRTMIISTHRMELLPVVDRVIWLEDGRIVADKSRDAVVAQLRAAGAVRGGGPVGVA